ncbi:hypothetical protein GCM10008171_12640 [Methylopila jiangsuensis]|uniref:Homeodomain-like domain-containing protein n=1 Tax=Methylopila jiangsuensis TaxID=586230 RepID=A0A9W6JHN8_9HYPH|nr:hypothetical protein [Methylopila jiangsuensis]MDR6286247.1 hypothetical protein [Methylopila jiangsuensis]GLK76010.1 hypothetical protein GCM10008171_12640 [Methylopila jiangsuensis]
MTGPKPPAPHASPEVFAEARRLYETTQLSQVEIGRRLGLSRHAVARRAKREAWTRPFDAARRRTLIRGLRRSVDAEVAKAERLFASGDDGAAGEAAGKAARTLSSLVRSLRELAKFDEESAGGAGEPDADGSLRDADEFRAALAERLERLRRERGE